MADLSSAGETKTELVPFRQADFYPTATVALCLEKAPLCIGISQSYSNSNRHTQHTQPQPAFERNRNRACRCWLSLISPHRLDHHQLSSPPLSQGRPGLQHSRIIQRISRLELCQSGASPSAIAVPRIHSQLGLTESHTHWLHCQTTSTSCNPHSPMPLPQAHA